MGAACQCPEFGSRGVEGRWPRTIGGFQAHAGVHRTAGLADMSAPVSVIDRSRGVMPRAFDRKSAPLLDPAARAKLAQLQSRAEGREAPGIVELAVRESFPGRTALVSSFGSESVVLLHLVAQVDPTTPILFLNTGKLFGETLRYRDRLQDELGLGDVRSLAPSLEAREKNDPDGTLWSRDTDACCDFRKTIPLAKALAPFKAQVTGR